MPETLFLTLLSCLSGLSLSLSAINRERLTVQQTLNSRPSLGCIVLQRAGLEKTGLSHVQNERGADALRGANLRSEISANGC
jgi:hypothetical protein